MQKVLKRIVAWIGIILLGMVIILNLMYNVELNVYESAIILKNIILYLLTQSIYMGKNVIGFIKSIRSVWAGHMIH